MDPPVPHLDPAEPAGDAAARQALRDVLTDWNAAAHAWDADALAAVYAPDALFFGGRPGHAVGRIAIRTYFASYDGVIETATLALVHQHLMPLAPAVVLAQGYGDFSFRLAGYGATRSRVRTTLLLERQDRWRIRQHHFSPTPEAPPLGR